MNVIQKAGCIGALVAGLCASETKAHADYSSLPRTHAVEMSCTYQVEKKQATQADKDKMALLGFAGVMVIVGMCFAGLYACRDNGDYH